MRTYEEILKELIHACAQNFYNGCHEVRKELIESATKIYIAELEADTYNKNKNDWF